jgi:hypothetical protein
MVAKHFNIMPHVQHYGTIKKVLILLKTVYHVHRNEAELYALAVPHYVLESVPEHLFSRISGAHLPD